MSHIRSGLPPLNLEPFDPTPLYAAANSPRREKHQPHFKEKRNPFVTGVAAAVVIAVGALVAFVLS